MCTSAVFVTMSVCVCVQVGYMVVECNEQIENVMGLTKGQVPVAASLAVFYLDDPSLRKYIRHRYAENHAASDPENAMECALGMCKQLDNFVAQHCHCHAPCATPCFAFYRHTKAPFRFGGSMMSFAKHDDKTEAAYPKLLQLCLSQVTPDAMFSAQAAQLTVTMPFVGVVKVSDVAFFNVDQSSFRTDGEDVGDWLARTALTDVRPSSSPPVAAGGQAAKGGKHIKDTHLSEMEDLLRIIHEKESRFGSLRKKFVEFMDLMKKEDWHAALVLDEQVRKYSELLRAQDPENILSGDIYRQLGECYHSLKQISGAIDLYEQSKVMMEKISDTLGLTLTLMALGKIYEGTGQHHKAIAIYEQRIRLPRLKDSPYEDVLRALSLLGDCYWSLAEYAKSMDLQEQCRKGADFAGSKLLMARSRCQTGRCLQSMGQFAKSIEIAEKGRAIAEEMGDVQLEGEICSLIGLSWTSLGSHDKAITYQKKYWMSTRYITIYTLYYL